MIVDAMDLARDSSGFGFGMDKTNAAAALRKLADAIESDDVALQSGRVTQLSSIEDYTITSLRIVYSERKR